MRNLVLWNLAAVMCLLVRPYSSIPLTLIPVTQSLSSENDTDTDFSDYENDQEIIEVEERGWYTCTVLYREVISECKKWLKYNGGKNVRWRN